MNRLLQQTLSLALLTGVFFSSSTGLVQAQSPDQPLSAHLQFDQYAYTVGPGDILSMHVYHPQELSQERILVNSDGMATFNNLGQIPIQGKTLSEVQKIVTTAMSELVRDPRVTISVVQTKPGVVYLSGAVKQPGMYEFFTDQTKTPLNGQTQSRSNLRLSNVLANAGGVSMKADLANVEITRARTGDVLKINLWEVLRHGLGAQDMMLDSGDVVHIPELEAMALDDDQFETLLKSPIGPQSIPVRVIGQATSPGVYNLDGQTPYLNTALAMAGGYDDDAKQNVVAIRRRTADNDMSTFYVDPTKHDLLLRPNDIVVVAERRVYRGGKTGRAVSDIISPITGLAGTILSIGFLTN